MAIAADVHVPGWPWPRIATREPKIRGVSPTSEQYRHGQPTTKKTWNHDLEEFSRGYFLRNEYRAHVLPTQPRISTTQSVPKNLKLREGQ